MTMLENLQMQLQYTVEKYGRERARNAGAKAADKRNRAIEALGPRSPRDAAISRGLPQSKSAKEAEDVGPPSKL